MSKKLLTVTIDGLDYELTEQDTLRLVGIVHGMRKEYKRNAYTPKNTRNNASAKKSAPSTKGTKAKKSGGYADFTGDFDNVVVKATKNTIAYTHTDGTYLHEKAVRQALNQKIKDNGGQWDKDAKAWVFPTAKDAKEFAKSVTLVTVDELNAVVAKWNAKATK